MNVKKNVCSFGEIIRKLIDEGRATKERFYSRAIVMTLVCLLSATKLSAFDFESDGLCFNVVSEEDGTVEVTWRNYLDEHNDYVKGDLTVPRDVTNKDKTYTVIKIGKYAFYGCNDLTSVTIPNSVTEIGFMAFRLCRGLRSVAMPNSVTEIGEEAFGLCGELTSVVMSNSLTKIGDYAFADCSGLISLTIPNSVETMGANPFSGCKLTSLNLDNSNPLFAVDGYVLYSKDMKKVVGCFNIDIVNVSIPNSVTEIGNLAFAWCSGLTSVVIPNSITEIGNFAFGACNLEFIDCMATVPPHGSPWDNKAYGNTILYVPQGSLNVYKSTDPWSKFLTIEEKDFSGIDDVKDDTDAVRVTVDGGCIRVSGMTEDANIEVYDLTGHRIYSGAESTIDGLSSGTYVVRVAGKPHKVMVR